MLGKRGKAQVLAQGPSHTDKGLEAGVCAHVCEPTHTWGTGRKPSAMEGV